MTMFDEIKSILADWVKRRDTQSKLDRLVELVAATNASLDNSKSPFLALAMQRLERAENARKKALLDYEEDDVVDCESRCERGLMHLMIAALHLSSDGAQKLAVEFEEDSAEDAIQRLGDTIAKVKMAVEYSNCVVNDHVRERLLRVARKFEDSLFLFEEERDREAKRLVEGALVWLYLVAKQLESDNARAIIEFDPLAGKSNCRELQQLKNLADHIARANDTLAVSHTRGYKRVERYLTAAVETFDKATECYFEEDDSALMRLVAAGAMEARMAIELCKTGINPHNVLAGEGEEWPTEMKIDVNEFCRRLVSLSRLLKDNMEDPERILSKIDAVNFYFRKTVTAIKDGDFKEAQRSARAAHLDLDYATQLVSGKSASYRDL